MIQFGSSRWFDEVTVFFAIISFKKKRARELDKSLVPNFLARDRWNTNAWIVLYFWLRCLLLTTKSWKTIGSTRVTRGLVKTIQVTWNKFRDRDQAIWYTKNVYELLYFQVIRVIGKIWFASVTFFLRAEREGWFNLLSIYFYFKLILKGVP